MFTGKFIWHAKCTAINTRWRNDDKNNEKEWKNNCEKTKTSIQIQRWRRPRQNHHRRHNFTTCDLIYNCWLTWWRCRFWFHTNHCCSANDLHTTTNPLCTPITMTNILLSLLGKSNKKTSLPNLIAIYSTRGRDSGVGVRKRLVTCTWRSVPGRGWGWVCPCRRTWRRRVGRTSARYILIRPLLTLAQLATPLMFHSWFECSANGPVFTWRAYKKSFFFKWYKRSQSIRSCYRHQLTPSPWVRILDLVHCSQVQKVRCCGTWEMTNWSTTGCITASFKQVCMHTPSTTPKHNQHTHTIHKTSCSKGIFN